MTDRGFTEHDIERALLTASDRIAVPAMGDTVTPAIQRIRANHAVQISRGQTSEHPEEEGDWADPVLETGGTSITRLEARRSRRRELALLAGGIAAAAVVTVTLVALFQGLLGTGRDDDNRAANGEPLAAPFAIPGYDFVRAYGRPTIPNEPVDVLFDETGRMFTVDAGIGRVVALGDDGMVDTSWGNEGFSEPLRADAIRGAIGPNGSVYVYERGNFIDQVTVLNEDGKIVDEWDLGPVGGVSPGGVSSSVSRGDIAVDTSGIVYVARPLARHVVRFGADGSQLPPVQFTDSGPAALSATEQGIYVVTGDGTLWSVVDNEPVEVDGPDLTRVATVDATNDGSIFALELRRDEPARVTQFTPGDDTTDGFAVDIDADVSATGAVTLPGLAVDPEGQILITTSQRILVYDSAGELHDTIRDSDPISLPSLDRIAIGPDGKILALSITGRTLQSYDADGEHAASFELLDQSEQFLTEDLHMSPADVAAGDDHVIVIDQRASHVYRFDQSGEPLDNWSGLNRDDGFSSPRIVDAASNGSIYLVDDSNQIKHYSPSGEFVNVFGDFEDDIGDIAVVGDEVWAVAGGSIHRFGPEDETGEMIATITHEDDDGGEQPVVGAALAVAPDGTIALVSKSSLPLGGFPATLTILDASGDVLSTTELPVPANVEVDVAFGPDDDLYITDALNKMVYRYAPAEREVDKLPTPGDELPDEPKFAIDPGQPEPHPFEIPGYEFTRAIGGPTVPNEPIDVAVGDDGAYYVLDAGLNRIVALDPEGEVIESWGENGLSDELNRPIRLTRGPDETFYVLERGTEEATIALLGANGQLRDRWSMPSSEGSPQPIGPAALNAGGVVVADGAVYVADVAASRVVIFDSEGRVQAEIAFFDGAPAAISNSDGQILILSASGTLWQIVDGGRQRLTDLPVASPLSMTADSTTLYILNLNTNSSDDPWEVVRVRIGESTADRWDTDISGFSFGFESPTPDIALGPTGDIAVSALHQQRIAVYSGDGELQFDIVGDQPDQLAQPWRIAIGPDETLNVFDRDDRARIARFDSQGKFLDAFLLSDQFNLVLSQNPLLEASSFGIASDGEIVIPRRHPGSRVHHYAPDGTPVREWGEFGFDSDEGLTFPTALDVAADGSIYLHDESGRIKHFSAQGEFLNAFGSIPGQRVDLHVTDEHVWVLADASLTRFSLDGTESEVVVDPEELQASGAIPGDFFSGYAFDIAPDGTIALVGIGTPAFTSYIVSVTPDGDVIDAAPLRSDDAYIDIAFAPDGTLYLSDSESRWIDQFEPSS